MLLNYGVTTFIKQLKVPEYQLTRMFNERPICGITVHLLDRVTSDQSDKYFIQLDIYLLRIVYLFYVISDACLTSGNEKCVRQFNYLFDDCFHSLLLLFQKSSCVQYVLKLFRGLVSLEKEKKGMSSKLIFIGLCYNIEVQLVNL